MGFKNDFSTRYGQVILAFFLVSLLISGRLYAEEYTRSPQRIISLGPGITKKLFLLGVEDKIVANTTYCTYPEAARNKEKIGNVILVNIEKILSLQPDLVLAIGLTPPRQVEKMERLGLKVVRFVWPESFEMLCSDFLRLGELVGCQEKAEQIINQVKGDVEAIQNKVTPFPKKKVFIHSLVIKGIT